MQVKEFERWNEDELCDCVKQISYTEHTHIVLKGDKIDEILFVGARKAKYLSLQECQYWFYSRLFMLQNRN
ncbi:hypothetical protein Ddye_013419 [Dipteronia dyeriana]|uniref:Uncharacterized protein n=1 Tax=Dipteronia dyeriana TaxID=168575 RepID=A0AAE0CK70_9ROSI|nr:hypothetical protein Ddye_013419 [Dipteronia dyeriana]